MILHKGSENHLRATPFFDLKIVGIWLHAVPAGIALVPSFFDTSAVSNIVNKPLEDTLIEFEQCLVFRADRFSEMSAVLK